jgi:hypothetical protein
LEETLDQFWKQIDGLVPVQVDEGVSAGEMRFQTDLEKEQSMNRCALVSPFE